MSARTLLVNVGALLAFAAVPVSAHADLITVSFDFSNSSIHRIDENTGAGVLVGPSGFARLNSSARNRAGTLYSVGGTPDNLLVTIDPNTGAGSLVATLPHFATTALAFSPNDILYGARLGAPGPTNMELVIIDVNSGGVTLVGRTGLTGLQALAFSPDGTLYGWDSGDGIGRGLVRINPLTGAVTDVNPAIGGSAFDVQGLAFGPDGTLYGARSSLFTINLSTGALTRVGSGGYTDVRGLEFVGVSPTIIPEPSSLALLGLGALSLLRYNWRRGRALPLP